jgi:KAP family P-loop domain
MHQEGSEPSLTDLLLLLQSWRIYGENPHEDCYAAVQEKSAHQRRASCRDSQEPAMPRDSNPNPKRSGYSGTSKIASDAAPRTGSSGTGWRRSAANRITYLFAAVACFLVLTLLALVQPPRAVPHPAAMWNGYAFWAYPIVVNDIKRLQRITVSGASTDATLNAVSISGNEVWIAGNNGILLRSPDLGKTWKTVPKSGDSNVQANQSRNWIDIAKVEAAARDEAPSSSNGNPNVVSPSGSTPAQQNPAQQNPNAPPSLPVNNANGTSQQAPNAAYRPPTSKLQNQQEGLTPKTPFEMNGPKTTAAQKTSGSAPESKPAPATSSLSGQQAQPCSIAGKNLEAIAFVDRIVRVLVAPGVTVCASNDMGERWTTYNSSRGDNFVMSLSSRNFGALRNGYRISFDPGKGIVTSRGNATYTWRVPGGAYIKAINFANDERVGFAVGSSGSAFETIDFGRTWFPVLQGAEGEQLGDRLPHKLPAPWYYLSWLLVGLIAAPALKKPTDAELLGKETIADIGISDRPLEPGDPDPLGYRELALSISRFLRNENTIAPITIAITGDWGTGKSSIMNLLRRDLSSRGLQSIWFNAWHNQTEDDLFATILQAVRKQGVPQWWELDYLPFRLRLLWIRWRSRWQSITLLLMAIALLTGIEWQHRSEGSHTVSDFFDSLKSWQSFIDGLKNLSHDTLWVLVICILYAGKHLYDGLKAFGVDPASLLASRSGTTSLPDLEKQTALRQSFAQELREVTQALGKSRRMVIFIDDLDRCMPDNIRIVLEAVNFIVTSGECFVIMGLSRRPVEAGIGLSFEQIADEMTWSTTGEGPDPEETAKEKRLRFSRQYLDKLINIEIPARPISSARYKELVLDNARSAEPVDLVSYIARRSLRILLPILVSVLLIASMASLGLWIGGSKQSSADSSGTQVANPAAPIQNLAQANASTGTATAPTQATASTFSLAAPDQAGLSELSYIGVVLGSGLLLYLCWRILTRKEDVVVKDSPKFRQALELWDSVIVLSHETPRSTKRFMNRLRCLAMRLRPAPEERTRWGVLRQREPNPAGAATSAKDTLPESMLVALSALYDIAPEMVRRPDLFSNALQGKFYIAAASDKQPARPLVAESLETLLRSTLEEHESKFADEWSPTEKQREAFLNMSADVTVRG